MDIIVGIYFALMSFVLLYSFVQLSLVVAYLFGKEEQEPLANNSNEKIPKVTVQLPVYNEYYVIERLIDAVAQLNYPKDKLEIQVLDDSTDHSLQLAIDRVAHWRKLGVNINHIYRKKRQGYKAGALAEGLKIASGELIAIFDADFVPDPDFLYKTTSHFFNPSIGLVQARWSHLNEDFSLLTKLQAFGLNAHFSVEQMGRNKAGHFMSFNGTAGVWRKQCIIEAGGWQSDTLTEDLDLSYRAQLKGWEFKFLERVAAPAELPVAMNALKTQQFRWTKGAAECSRKNLLNVLKNNSLSFSSKMHAFFHLTNSFLFVCIILTSILSVPMLVLKQVEPLYTNIFLYASVFLISLIILCAFFWTSFDRRGEKTHRAMKRFILSFPMFLSVSMGLSLHNAIAAVEGYLGKASGFMRTPKFNILAREDNWQANQYLTHKLSWVTLLEGFFALYFTVAIGIGVYLEDYGLMPFHLMLSFGFSLVFYYTLTHSLRSNRVSRK